MFSGSSCQKEKNILAAKFLLCATIIISWRQDHSLERPALKHSWLASKACTSARCRRWEQKQREEQYRTFLTNLCKKAFLPAPVTPEALFKDTKNSFVPFFPSKPSATSTSWETGFVKKIDARKKSFNIARLTSRWRQDSDVTLALQDFKITIYRITRWKSAAPFDHANQKYVVDDIQDVLSFRLHQKEDHFEQLATCVNKNEMCHQLLKKR